MIVDTSALLAYFNERDPDHEACMAVIDRHTEELVVSPYVIAELDYLILSREGVNLEVAALDELVGRAWTLAAPTDADVVAAVAVIRRYPDQKIGLADAANVVLADRYRTRTIATLDHRHFDVLRPLTGGRFRVVP